MFLFFACIFITGKAHISNHGSSDCKQLVVKSSKLQDTYAYFKDDPQNVQCWAIDIENNEDTVYDGINEVDEYCGDVAGSFIVTSTNENMIAKMKPISLSTFTVNLFEVKEYKQYVFREIRMGDTSNFDEIATCLIRDFEISSNFINKLHSAQCRYFYIWSQEKVYDSAKAMFVNNDMYMDYFVTSLFEEHDDIYAQVQLKDLLSYKCISAGAHSLRTTDGHPLTFAYPFKDKVKYILDNYENKYDDKARTSSSSMDEF